MLTLELFVSVITNVGGLIVYFVFGWTAPGVFVHANDLCRPERVVMAKAMDVQNFDQV